MSNKAALTTVFLAVLIDLMGFGIVLPLLPFYASTFKASPVAIGLLYSIYSLAQLIFSPIWGGFSDRIGRRPIMLMSTLGASLAYLRFGLAHSFILLFFSRLIAGRMGGNISTAQAYVADVTSPEERAQGMGLVGAAFGIGFVMGPAIASFVIHPAFLKLFRIPLQNKYAVPGFVADSLSFLSFLLVLFKLPETAQSRGGDPERILKSSIFTKSFWQSIVSQKSSGMKYLFPMLMGSVFLYSFAQSSLYSSFPLFCEARLKLSAEKVGALYAYLGLIAVIVQGGLIKNLVKRFGEQRLFLMGSVLMVTGFALVPLAHSMKFLILFLALLSLGGSLMGPTLNSLISKEADPSKIGRAMGTSQGMAALGRVAGPTWGGFLYGFSPGIPFLATASCLSLTILVGRQLLRHKHLPSN